MIGFLVVRSAGEALDDLAALVLGLRQPGRDPARTPGAQDLAATHDPKPLLAPWWVPYRHGLDFVGDIAAAATNQAQDVADRRRAAKEAAAPAPLRRPVVVTDDDDAVAEDTGLVARFFTNPLAVALALVVVLLDRRGPRGVRARHRRRPGARAGRRAGPVDALDSSRGTRSARVPRSPPRRTSCRWRCWARLLGNSAAAAVSAVLLLAVPLALWGAWRLLRVVGRLVDPGGSPRWLVALGAVTYALVPGHLRCLGRRPARRGRGRGDPAVPWIAHAALGFSDPEPDRRWRAAWRTGLLLAIAAAFSPSPGSSRWCWPLVAHDRSPRRHPQPPARPRASGARPLVALGVSAGAARAVVAAGALARRRVAAADGDRAVSRTRRSASPTCCSAGSAAGVGGPWWLGALLVVLAALALIPRATRIPVLVAWLVAAVAALTATVLSFVPLPLPGGSVRPGIAVMLVVLHGCFVLAAMLGAQGLVTILRRSRRRAPPGAAGRPGRRGGDHPRDRPRLVRLAGPRRPRQQRGHRHPGVHDRRLGRARRQRDPGDPRRRGARAAPTRSVAATATRSARTRSSTPPSPTRRSPPTCARWSRDRPPAWSSDLAAGRHPLRRPARAGRRRRRGRPRRHRRAGAGQRREPDDARLVGRDAGRPARDGRARSWVARPSCSRCRGSAVLVVLVLCLPTWRAGHGGGATTS